MFAASSAGRDGQSSSGVGGAVQSTASFDRARARVQFRTLPTDLDAATAIAELDEGTRRLSTTSADMDERLADDLDAMWASANQLGERVTTEVGRLDQQTRRIASGGARIEAAGLFAVALGTTLQVIATIIG